MVNMLLGGFDPTSQESELYFIDYLGSFQKVPFATHGYGGFFCMGIMDRFHRKGKFSLFFFCVFHCIYKNNSLFYLLRLALF